MRKIVNFFIFPILKEHISSNYRITMLRIQYILEDTENRFFTFSESLSEKYVLSIFLKNS